MASEKEKDFEGWHALKAELDSKEPPVRGFNEGEVWLCALGHNIGRELDGKTMRYWRPVLVLQKFSPEFFIGIPISRTSDTRPFRIPVQIPENPRHKKGVKGYLIINQIRALDARRLRQRLTRLSPEALLYARTAVIEMLEPPRLQQNRD